MYPKVRKEFQMETELETFNLDTIEDLLFDEHPNLLDDDMPDALDHFISRYFYEIGKDLFIRLVDLEAYEYEQKLSTRSPYLY